MSKLLGLLQYLSFQWGRAIFFLQQPVHDIIQAPIKRKLHRIFSMSLIYCQIWNCTQKEALNRFNLFWLKTSPAPVGFGEKEHLNKLCRVHVPDAVYLVSRSLDSWFWWRFFKDFYHIWAWRPSWSYDQDHLYKLWFPHTTATPYEIWLAGWFLRRRCLKSVDDDRRPTFTLSSPISLPHRAKYRCSRTIISTWVWASSRENLSSGFSTRVDTNRPALLTEAS